MPWVCRMKGEATVSLTPGDELRLKLDVVKAFGETAKSYIQISSAALALPLLFTQAILGKNAAENGLRSVGVPLTLYGAWGAFLFSIGFGLIYQWSSIRRVWDELHEMQITDQNVNDPGFRRTSWVGLIQPIFLLRRNGRVLFCWCFLVCRIREFSAAVARVALALPF